MEALDWPAKMPPNGALEIDFVSVRGPARDAPLIDRQDLDNVRTQLGSPVMGDAERLALLRMFSSVHYFSCAQVRI